MPVAWRKGVLAAGGLMICCAPCLVSGDERFEAAKAEAIPTLGEGGFAAEPSFEDTFSPGWEATQKTWRVATWKQNGTQMAPERCRSDGQGLLLQLVAAGFPPRGGSLQTNREFGWGRWVARLKPSSVPGVLNSMFTKDWDDLKTADSASDGNKGEVDIEFLTHTFGDGRGEVHLAIHLNGRNNFWQRDVPLDFDPSDGFREWGFDLLPDRVVWHVDGKVLAVWRYSESDFLDPGYEFFFNSWTKEKWIKGPPSREAVYEIDWVKFYPLLGEF